MLKANAQMSVAQQLPAVLRELAANGTNAITHVPWKFQDDIFTKPLRTEISHFHRNLDRRRGGSGIGFGWNGRVSLR